MTLSIMRGLMPLEAEERGCHEVDVTDGSPWRALYALLGLGEPPEHVPTEEIAGINYACFKSNAVSGNAADSAAEA